MNFLNVDFPEVTEAYRGSLEDWLDLFERYAFPKTGDTETSIEMKRIFKRYPEVTYEDWLDSVIKSVRDELWYEEKINLSIREFYLVVRKYPRIEEKLKAIYNNFNPLTEDIETEDSKESENIADSSKAIEFAQIIAKAKAFGSSETKTLSDDDKIFWNGVKTLVWSKRLRKNMNRIPSWIDRLVDYFMKPLYMEDLLFDKLTNTSDYTSWYVEDTNIKLKITEIDRGDKSRKYLYPDSYKDNEENKVQPDFVIKGTISNSTENGTEKSIPFELKMECKSAQHNNSDIHEAPLVITYDLYGTYKQGTGNFYIDFTEYAFKEGCVLKEFLEGYGYTELKKLPSIFFNADFNKIGGDLGPITQEDWKNVEDFDALKDNLSAINKNLKDSDRKLTMAINTCTYALKNAATSPEVGLSADSIKTHTDRVAPHKAATALINAAKTVAIDLMSQSNTTQDIKKS